MKHIKKINEIVRSRKEIRKNKSDMISNIFYFLRYCEYTNKPEIWKFLEDLNLTEAQYTKLATIMEDYGQQKYNDGDDNARFEED